MLLSSADSFSKQHFEEKQSFHQSVRVKQLDSSSGPTFGRA